MQFHCENKTWASCLCVQVNPDSKIVWASAELIFLLSSVGSTKTCMLQTAANWDGTRAQTVCALMWRWGANCGSLFKLDRVEFVCTFEPFTPLPLHRFYQPSPSLYLPTQTWTHLSTKSSIKDTQTPSHMRTTIRLSEERNMRTMIIEQIKMWTAICVISFVFIFNDLFPLFKMSLKWHFCLLCYSNFGLFSDKDKLHFQQSILLF